MSNKVSVKQLDAIARVLSNTSQFLKNGLFPGANAQALLEAQGYIDSLLQQSQKALQTELDSRLADEEAKAEDKVDAVSEG
jgi:hypothetical protein